MGAVDRAALRALVVDDQAVSRDIVRENLANMGFKDIHLAATSAQAEEKIAAHTYDVIFVDWLMPGKSGFMLMQECRQNRAHDRVAFVMVTSQTDERFMVEALKAGATAYVVKPVMPTAFRAKVETVLDWLQKARAPVADTARRGDAGT